jgi:hypothetical protein
VMLPPAAQICEYRMSRSHCSMLNVDGGQTPYLHPFRQSELPNDSNYHHTKLSAGIWMISC